MTSSSAVKITQNLPDNVLGRSRVGFSISLGETGFRRFLSNLPHGQARYYEERSEVLQEPVVEVVLPDESLDMFNLESPHQTLSAMRVLSDRHQLNTTTYILDNVLRAVNKE
jgi:hypothetical protein